MVKGWIPRLVLAAALGGVALVPAADTGLAATSSCDLSAGAYSGPGGPGDKTPVARYTWTPLRPAAGREANFDASASADPDGDTIVSYAWNFGDGSGTSFATTPRTTHTFSSAGKFVVTLGVFDCRDGYGTVSAPITVGVTAVAGTGTTATAALCTSRQARRIRLSKRTISVVVSQGATKLRTYRSGKLRHKALSINGYGLPAGKLTVTIRSRAHGRTLTKRLSVRVCASPGR